MATKFGTKVPAEEVADQCKPQIKDKVVLTTGVSPGGIGASFCEIIAKYAPKLLILAGRDAEKCNKTAQAIAAIPNAPQTRVLVLDLASQRQIRAAAEEVKQYPESIDALVNNAGIMAAPYEKTADGLESHFGANHIGHFLFTNLIASKLNNGARVVNVTSDGYRLSPVRFQDYNFDGGKTYDRWLAYGQSKTANNLFAMSLNKRLAKRNIVSVSMHPGVIATNLMRYMSDDVFQELQKMDRDEGHTDYWGSFDHLVKTPSQGVATHVYTAFHPDVSGLGGRYFMDQHVARLEEMWCWGRDDVDAERLWALSEEIVGQSFKY